MSRRGKLATFVFAVLIATLGLGPALADKTELYFPTAKVWEKVDPAAVGWNADALDQAVDFAICWSELLRRSSCSKFPIPCISIWE